MRIPIIILPLLILFSTTLFAQDYSNKGKDFWIGYGNHIRMMPNNTQNPAEKMQLYITSDKSTTGKVEISGIGFSQNFSVSANQITTIDIPRSAALKDEGLYNYGIHVTAQLPVVVYSFVYVNAISGATLCLPTETLGKEYYSVNFTQKSNEIYSNSYFFVIAADTGTTTVEIIPSANTVGGRLANVPFTVDLKQGQVYQVLGQSSGLTGVDLTGSTIRSISNTSSSCKKIAVFSGAGKIKIGINCAGDAATSDNLYQQMYPKVTWGKKYIAVPSLTNSNNYFRICKSDPAANVWLNGTLIPSSGFINNFYYEFLSSAVNVIESDKPILVAQYFTTQGCESNNSYGDPDMIYLNPVEQTISHVTLNSMQPVTGTDISEHYLNIVLKNNPGAIQSFKIDGISYTNFTPVPNDPTYAYLKQKVNLGTHNVTCDTGFNIISYGFGKFESYGYSGGTNLKDLYQFVTIKNQYTTIDFPISCRNTPFYFSMVLPYQPTELQWKFNGLFTDTTIGTPVFDSTWSVNGKQLYRYRINKPYSVPNIGNYPIKIIAQNPTSEGCSGVQEIDYILEIIEKPKAQMSVNYTGCLSDSLTFNDVSVLDRAVIKRLWDFGDGNGAQIKNPAHKYNNTGNYTAHFNLVTDIGCLSDTATKVIEVNPAPVAKFNMKAPFCKSVDIKLSDASTVASGSIVKWSWKMGNGDSFVKTNNADFQYHYNNTGNYTVGLIVESDKGCLSPEESHSVKVSPIPDAGFAMPGNCISDPFSKFTDTSKIEDGSESGFSYIWNFGDANANASNPNTSVQKNPQHKYTATGDYLVSLIVNSNAGCADTIQQQFTINGALPLSAFTIKNGLEHCSNDSVYFTNNSTVDFGKIIKIEVDNSLDPTFKIEDEAPVPGKTYAFKYPNFFSPESKPLSLSLKAYSGISCENTSGQTIVIKAIPELAFDPLTPVCADVPPFTITQAKNIGTLTGTGIYTGTGISANGLFNPRTAGYSIDTLKYTFNADNGCSNSIKNTIQVFPVPTANAGPDVYSLEGGSVVLQGRGSGKNITYAWTPNYFISNQDTSRPTVSPLEDQYYKLTVLSSDGCTSNDMVLVRVLKKPLIPNAFSPNGDGIHDVWVIKYLSSYPDATVEIYNRYGQAVLKSLGYYKPWDGTYNGKPVPVGTYYYIINPKMGREQMSGFVDVIR